MIRLSKNTGFSPLLANGTVLTRQKMTEKLNETVFNQIVPLKKNLCSTDSFQSHYNSALPEKKNVRIFPLPQKDCDDYGGGMYVDVYNDYIRGYAIQIPVGKNKKIDVIELPEFMHESTHVLDYLLNPKYVRNYKKMCEKNIFDKKYFNVFTQLFENPDEMCKNSPQKMLHRAKNETVERLKKVPFSQKIVFLNFIKYAMELEEHAYNQGTKFAKLMKKTGMPVAEESLDGFADFMKYKQKHEIVKDIIKDEISKERQKV